MQDRLERLKTRFNELETEIQNPDLIRQAKNYKETMREHSYGRNEDAHPRRVRSRPQRDGAGRAEGPRGQTCRKRGESQGPPHPSRSPRRKKHHHGNPRRHGRRRSGPLRGRPLPHVHPLRRDEGLEIRSPFLERNRPRRLQGNHRLHLGQIRVRYPQRKARDASTRARSPSPSFPKPRKPKSTSGTKTSASTPCVPAAPAASA